MRVLLVSCYELGHQPLHVASAGAFLRGAGHDVNAVDLAVQSLDEADLDAPELVAIAVPMHTAMRLAVPVAQALRARRGPSVRIVLFGLYAPLCGPALRLCRPFQLSNLAVAHAAFLQNNGTFIH